MTRGHVAAMFLGAIALLVVLLSVFWTQGHTDPVDPATVYEMENYLRQKDCTQAMIDQSNGYNIDLPEGCPEHK